MKPELTFKDICTMLVYQEPFTLSRYGDGEWRAINDHQGANCDGHEYFNDMGIALGRILESRPEYYLAWHLETSNTDRAEVETYIETCSLQDIHWHCCSGIFHEAIKLGTINNIIKSLEDRNVLLVGPKYLQDVLPCDIVEVPKVNCWKDKKRIMDEIYHKALGNYDQVVLFCCSMAANVWIDECWKKDLFHTMIDLGSGLDYHAKNGIRSFIRKRMVKDIEQDIQNNTDK